MRDAIAKADVLASATGLKLGEIQSVDYSWGQVDLEVYPMDKCLVELICVGGGSNYDFNIEPDDIDAEDIVTVVWEIS